MRFFLFFLLILLSACKGPHPQRAVSFFFSQKGSCEVFFFSQSAQHDPVCVTNLIFVHLHAKIRLVTYLSHFSLSVFCHLSGLGLLHCPRSSPLCPSSSPLHLARSFPSQVSPFLVSFPLVPFPACSLSSFPCELFPFSAGHLFHLFLFSVMSHVSFQRKKKLFTAIYNAMQFTI